MAWRRPSGRHHGGGRAFLRDGAQTTRHRLKQSLRPSGQRDDRQCCGLRAVTSIASHPALATRSSDRRVQPVEPHPPGCGAKRDAGANTLLGLVSRCCSQGRPRHRRSMRPCAAGPNGKEPFEDGGNGLLCVGPPRGIGTGTAPSAIHGVPRLRGSSRAEETAVSDVRQVLGPVEQRHYGLRSTTDTSKDGLIWRSFGDTTIRRRGSWRWVDPLSAADNAPFGER